MKKIFKKKNAHKTEGKNLIANPKGAMKKVLGILTLGVVVLAFMASCEKKCKYTGQTKEGYTLDESNCEWILNPVIDPNEALNKEIAKLEKDSADITNDCRTARKNAIYTPDDISEAWNPLFNSGTPAVTIDDTLSKDEGVIDYLYSFGDPLLKNDETVKTYKKTIKGRKEIVAMLKEKRLLKK